MPQSTVQTKSLWNGEDTDDRDLAKGEALQLRRAARPPPAQRAAPQQFAPPPSSGQRKSRLRALIGLICSLGGASAAAGSPHWVPPPPVSGARLLPGLCWDGLKVEKVEEGRVAGAKEGCAASDSPAPGRDGGPGPGWTQGQTLAAEEHGCGRTAAQMWAGARRDRPGGGACDGGLGGPRHCHQRGLRGATPGPGPEPAGRRRGVGGAAEKAIPGGKDRGTVAYRRERGYSREDPDEVCEVETTYTAGRKAEWGTRAD
ncbi:PREDICTED: translation initiation factor IF-2-like [Chinchilla lanigera]|uniref:translation initiation factor IF-2-like n=1 Tax=Chinchilla lanigera TaxID=34839 RepID=UPI000696105B|nr:PREDICTED: translation initiation factor IF-2-like [Chinchilla lanigera]